MAEGVRGIRSRPGPALVALAAVLAAGCGNVVRERPDFFRTNTLLKGAVADLPDDGLADYAEPDGPGAIVGRYLADRGRDLADILSLSLLGGYGIGVNARATKAVQVGGGWYGAGRVGFIGRHAGVWWEDRREGGVSLAYAHSYSVPSGSGPITEHPDFGEWQARAEATGEGTGLGVVDFLGHSDRHFLDVGATAFAGGIGVDVALRTVELGDFLLGLFGVDYRSDDTVNREREGMVDLAVYMVGQRADELAEVLRQLDDGDRELFLGHPSDSVKAAALRSLAVVETRRPGYCRDHYARFLDRSRSDLQSVAVAGLRRVTGQDFGFDPDRRREENEQAIEAWREWLRQNP